MITYRLTFNSKSKSVKLPEAIQLAKINFPKTFTEIGNVTTIMTHECNRLFLRIIRLVYNLKGTSVEIDGEAVNDINKFISIVECENRNKCNGICTILYDYEFQLECIGIIPKDPNAFYNTGRWAFYNHDDVIEKSTPNYLLLKRDVYMKHYREDMALPARVCNKYNNSKILEAFNALPDTIRIDFSDDNFSIIDQLMKADNGHESDYPEGEMVVDISKKSIEALGKEIAKRLSELNALNKK